MKSLFDFLMVVITTIIFIRSISLITRFKSRSLADWVILLLYIFQTTPVIADFIWGIPTYSKWLRGFYYALSDDSVSVIYDLYILLINLALLYISFKASSNSYFETQPTESRILSQIPDIALFIAMLSPAIHVLISGNVNSFISYNSFDERGLQPAFTELNSILIIIAILALMIWYYRKQRNIYNLLILLIVSFIIIWISGKRYSVVTILFSLIYMSVLNHGNKDHYIKTRLLFVFAGISIIVYSIFYITSVKVIADNTFESIYAALRIDFGRDDVVKYTIWKEYINKEHILDYPLQTIISTVFMIVPRSLFPSKGYPHYRYLTASIYNTDIMNIPAGMTPSILEMMISNLRYFGIPICVMFLCWYCKKADKAKTQLQKYCYAMVIMGMLTQSLDSMIVLFYIVLYFIFFSKIRFTLSNNK